MVSQSLWKADTLSLCRHLDVGLPASRTVREYISVVLSYQFSGNLFQQPQEIQTVISRCLTTEGYTGDQRDTCKHSGLTMPAHRC